MMKMIAIERNGNEQTIKCFLQLTELMTRERKREKKAAEEKSLFKILYNHKNK